MWCSAKDLWQCLVSLCIFLGHCPLPVVELCLQCFRVWLCLHCHVRNKEGEEIASSNKDCFCLIGTTVLLFPPPPCYLSADRQTDRHTEVRQPASQSLKHHKHNSSLDNGQCLGNIWLTYLMFACDVQFCLSSLPYCLYTSEAYYIFWSSKVY
jgi:hypothetical protein